MALIACDECGKDISTKAEACPHCGNPVIPESVSAEAPGSLLVMCRKCTHVQEESEATNCERCGTNFKTGEAPSRTGCLFCVCMLFILVLSIVFIMTSDAGLLFKNKKIITAVHTGRGMFLEWKKDIDFVWKETRSLRQTIKENLVIRRFSDGSKAGPEPAMKSRGSFKDPKTGKIYRINEQGDLEIYDDRGDVRTIKKEK